LSTLEEIAFYIFCVGPALGVGTVIGLWLFISIMDFNALVGIGLESIGRAMKSRKSR
jgi:hypothetical protein